MTTWRQRHPFLYGLSQTFGIFSVQDPQDDKNADVRLDAIEGAIAKVEILQNMDDIVDRAKSALNGAYEGPWTQVGLGNIHVEPVGEHPPVAKAWTRGNGDFIAAARTLIPELIAEVERLRLANQIHSR